MKKNLGIAVLLTAGVIVGVFQFTDNKTMASSLASLSIEERYVKSTEFVNEVKKTPNEESKLLIAFDNFTNKEFVEQIVNEYDLKFEQVYHGYIANNNTFRGAYLKKDSETIKTALTNYESEILSIVESDIEQYTAKIKEDEKHVGISSATDEKTIEDKKAIEALKVLLADAQDQLDDIKNSGLKIYGIKVTANNDTIVKLSQIQDIKIIESINKESEKISPIFPTEKGDIN
jgi:hypothetical protein